jgi:predicted ribosome quality control (RQC) complex YloA/Tae2 family protein
MPLDGSFIACLRYELNAAIDCHIDKIHIPAKNEFVFAIRGKNFNKKLFISISPTNPRVSFTNTVFENPENPPMFCMLLRKYLASGRILSVEGLGAERLIIFKIQATNEMGDRVVNSLILEFLGQKTNLILVDESGRILDSARRSDIESGARLIQPGALYAPPETGNRIDLIDGDLHLACEKILAIGEIKLSDAILQNIAGVSPLICREIAYCLTGDCDSPVSAVTQNCLLQKLKDLKTEINSGGKPIVLFDQNGQPKDYSFTAIKQYENLFKVNTAESFSSLLEDFYGERDRIRRLEHNKSDLVKRIKNLIARNMRKLELRKGELSKSADREHLRIFGELIKANIYRIPKGATKAVVENYYDPDCKQVEIPLNSALSPANNAAKYFKEYKKACTAEQTLGELIKECENELLYLESVLFELQAADSSAELLEIRAELIEMGYIPRNSGNKKVKITATPYEFSKNGFKILVGRNNLQNDKLTTKIASKNDLWFHTKNIHGSHVILFTEGKEPDDETLLYAANLAAYFSKGGTSNQVPVDYTPVKYVKKPNGAKPGMVIYQTNKTIFADPREFKL